MKVIVALDSFKGSLTSMEACKLVEKGIKSKFKDIDVVKVPISDGGEGFIETIGGKKVYVTVKDPLYRDIISYYGIVNEKTAVIEMSLASGLTLLDINERNPLITSTYGTGQLILDALDKGIRDFIIGIGGSATNDAGVGMLMALGARFLDKDSKSIDLGGKALNNLAKIDLDSLDERLHSSRVIVACDVENTLYGKNGASKVFAAQKGATNKDIDILESAIINYANILDEKLNIKTNEIKGSGAAGGLGSALIAVLNGCFKRGIDIVIEKNNLEEKIRSSDLVITGEGKIDYQTQFGKAPLGIARMAKKYGVPAIRICGTIGENIEKLYEEGFTSIFSIINKPMSLENAMKESEILLQNVSERIIRIYKDLYNKKA